MKIQAIVRFTGPEGSINKGQVIEVGAERGAKLIKMGFCIEAKQAKVEVQTKEEKKTNKTK